ncbi:hypothetical protein V6N13_098941 [Hibiscus sabdariffa]
MGCTFFRGSALEATFSPSSTFLMLQSLTWLWLLLYQTVTGSIEHLWALAFRKQVRKELKIVYPSFRVPARQVSVSLLNAAFPLLYDKLKKAFLYLYYSIPPNENDFLSLAHGGERVAAQAALFTQFLDLIGTLPSKESTLGPSSSGFQPGYKYDLFSLVLSVCSPFYRAASTPIPRIESVFFDDFSSGMKLSFPAATSPRCTGITSYFTLSKPPDPLDEAKAGAATIAKAGAGGNKTDRWTERYQSTVESTQRRVERVLRGLLTKTFDSNALESVD